ncbi:acyltransferase 3 [Rhodomicrobium vannielii ATCC 17100]|uniref:Acyltransferase 3 n=1 Tax=Rhodomicrobium vannielii (strain ATCC 17100 / DSM 162 / LMG 4299 / NCIMB 10020 / ATH 3.1.1) TaxID=648757 RepID=E3I181_RHOVT|nr:acyltransferase [Rhodomicrobium vannielii]ADP70094.1 acyltransferase 3 [Rhodomicrobium vannielii ATCC 17100]
MRPAFSPTHHFAFVDGLRGLAALSVLVFHYQHFFMPKAGEMPSADVIHGLPLYSIAYPFYNYGWIGVQIFWIISGFVFAHIYLRAPKMTAADFFLRRFARLYPLHFATLLAVAALQAISIRSTGHFQIYENNDAQHFLLHLFMASNWFQRGDWSFNGPIWSVSVEVLIYAVFFALIPFLTRRRFLRFLAALSFVGLYGLGFKHVAIECAVCFFAGASLYTVAEWRGMRRRVIVAPVLVAALAVLAIFAARMSDNKTVVLWTFAASAVTVFVCLDLLLSHRAEWLKRLGDISYPVYLLHVPVQIALLTAFDWGMLDRSMTTSAWFMLAFIVAIVLAALYTHRHFEMPAQKAIRAALSRTRKREGRSIDQPA